MPVDLSQRDIVTLLMAELEYGYNASKDGVGGRNKKR